MSVWQQLIGILMRNMTRLYSPNSRNLFYWLFHISINEFGRNILFIYMNDYFALNSDLELADVGNRIHIFELLAIILFADFCNYEHLSHPHRVAFWKQDICTCYLYKMENGKFIIWKIKNSQKKIRRTDSLLFYIIKKINMKIGIPSTLFSVFLHKICILSISNK